MGYELPPLPWLRSFEAAARQASITAAARELNLTQPAVSHHIRCLEDRLGARLFHRQARRVELTDLGRAYLPAVRAAFAQVSAATAGLFGVPGERSVTVRCTSTFAALCLAPRLGMFRRKHPRIGVRLYTAIWSDHLTVGNADIDIRYGAGAWDGFEARLLQAGASVAVCSPGVAAGLGPAPAVAGFAALDLITVMGCETFWSTWFATGGVPDAPPARGLIVDTSVSALEVAAAGAGAALVLESFAAGYIAAGRVVAPVAHSLPDASAHYLLLPDDGSVHRPETLIFRDWLLETFAAGAAAITVP